MPQLFIFDGRQVSDRPENLVGPPALGYLVSWWRSWVLVWECGGLRGGRKNYDKSAWRWSHQKIARLCHLRAKFPPKTSGRWGENAERDDSRGWGYLLGCDGFRLVFNVICWCFLVGGFGGIFHPIFIHCFLHGSSHCSISFVFSSQCFLSAVFAGLQV